MNKKSYSFDMETFRSMLQMCPKLPGQQFVDPPFEEGILTFMRELGYPGNIKLLSDVKVDTAQILWGLYHQETVDYVYLIREDLVYQIENKETRKNKYMFYPRFTKVIINHFMSQDKSISRRNKVDWHMANDDPILTTMRFIPQHEVVQRYGAILPDYLVNPAMKESEAYKTYHDLATGKVQPKLKYVRRSSKSKTEQAPKPYDGKRVKTTAKVAKFGKKKQPASGLETLSDIALTKAEQMKLATKRSLIQTHSSHASGSGAHEGTGVTPGVPDVPNYDSNEEQLSWKSTNEEDDDDEANIGKDKDDDAQNDDDDAEQDDDDKRTESDNDGDEFVHPKFTTHDDEAMHEEEVNEEDSFDPRVHTPSCVESTYNEDNDDEIQGVNIEGEKMDEDTTNVEDEGNELYKDVNVNLEGRDAEMIDVPLPNSSSVSSGFVSNMLNPNQDACIDSLFGPNTKATSFVDVPVTAIAKPSSLATITLPLPLTPLFTHLQQTPVLTPATVLSSSLQDLPNFGSLFGFDHRLKALEDNFSEFKQRNQFAEVVSSIPCIVDQYLENKMNDTVKTAVQLQSERLREEAQAENQEFINTIDEGMKKIIQKQVKDQVKDQVSKILPRIEKLVNDQLEAEVLVEAYESDKLLLDTYGDTVSFKKQRDNADKDEEPSGGSNRGSKRRRAGKEPESTSAPKEKTSKASSKSTERSKSHHRTAGESTQVEEPIQTAKDMVEPTHQEFETGVTEYQPNEETSQFPDWFQKPTRLPSPNRDWNKKFPNAHGPAQPWLNSLAQKEYPCESFDELLDTPLDFSAFIMNRLKVDTLTPELLTGPTFELMKGACKSLVELEYFFEEVYKATTKQLDWINPEGQQYPHDLRKPLPLIPNSRGLRVIPFDHFIDNDLEYLSGGVSSWKYATSVTKTKAADYGHIKWIEDLVPNTMWSQVLLEILEWHNYKHLDWITVRRDDDKLYKFKEGDFNRLRIQDIEDMLLLLVQGKLTNLTVQERLAFNVSLRMFTRSVVIQRPDLKRKEAYTAYSSPRGFIYQNKDKKNRLMRIDELHKFSDGTLDDVRNALNDRLKGIRMQFYTSAENPVKKILLKLNLSDHRKLKDGSEDFRYSDTKHLSRSDEVLKLKNFKKDAILKLFKSTIKKGMSMSVQKSQVHKMAKSQDGEIRLCLVDDLKVFKITFKTS
ncbi:hypothetical protein Tco_1123801 [Tanacetum coccineum]|uniref:Uncharacterized protein n=1 Tax=Tanacetum coccineum TaxID=301880 RepID=A0ABQ5J5G5_9ASTR